MLLTRASVWSSPQASPTICSPSKSGTSSGKWESSSWPVPSRPLAALPQLHGEDRKGCCSSGGARSYPHSRSLPMRHVSLRRNRCTLPQAGAQPHLWHMVSTGALAQPCASKALPRSAISSVASTLCTRPAAIRACLRRGRGGGGRLARVHPLCACTRVAAGRAGFQGASRHALARAGLLLAVASTAGPPAGPPVGRDSVDGCGPGDTLLRHKLAQPQLACGGAQH